MEITDARAILNLKKRLNFKQQRNLSVPRNNITDARQILKSRRRNNSRTWPTSTPIAFVKKELSHIFKSKVNSPMPWKNRKHILLSDKRVQVESSGILTVTSKGDTDLTRASNKRILSNRSGILVIENEKFQQRGTEKMEIEDGDDLETMTLGDFPDIKTFRQGPSPTLKTSYQSSFLQRTPWKPSTSSTFAGQTPNQTNTMVADTVSLSSSCSSCCPGHCVLVTNLHHSVTQEDVMELFGDIGKVTNALLVEPGTALVCYFTKKEAMQAYDTYHNRLLDGQPMQCAIVQSNTPSIRSPLSSRLGAKLTPGDSSELPSSFQVASPGTSRMSSSHFQNSNVPLPAKTSGRSVQFTVRMP